MPKYLIRAYDEGGALQAEDEFDCSDDEFENEYSDRVIQPAYYGASLVLAYELRRVKVLRYDI